VQPRQIVRAADDEREIVDLGRCRPPSSLLDHRSLRIHDDNLADEGRKPQRDMRRSRSEIEDAIGT